MDLHTAEEQNKDIVSQLGCSDVGSSEKVVQCMRNKSVEDIRKTVPKTWDTVKRIWALPPAEAAKNPKGLDLPGEISDLNVGIKRFGCHNICYMLSTGVAIVDGVVVKKPLLDALHEGMIDVPLILGTMAQEPDAQPNKVLWDTSVSDFKKLINDTFQPWGKGTGPKVLEMYEDELNSGGPEKAYCTLIADYGATCANIDVAKAAAQGFSSPVYSYVITQCPVDPVWNFGMCHDLKRLY